MYTYKKCCSGKKLVDWVISQSTAARSRQQVVTMWQALLTERIIQHGKKKMIMTVIQNNNNNKSSNHFQSFDD